MNFQSSKDMLKHFHPRTTSEFLSRGYVVFAVVHGSQPKFTVPEIVDDIHLACGSSSSTPSRTGSNGTASASRSAPRAAISP